MFSESKDKALWERVRTSDVYARHRKEIKEKYDALFKVAPRPRSAQEIIENKDHQTYYRTIGQLQASALMALIYPDNEEYYNSLVDTVWAYCNEYSWAPLGHYNEYYDRTPADYDPGLIDIFAASIAFSMAEIKSLFADRFPKLLIDRMTAEIRRHAIEPFLERRFFWEHHNNNWTAVCAGAIGGVLMYEAPDIFMQEKHRFDSAMECYLASYKEDGMCVEGTAYWGFGFGFFAAYAMLLREFTNGECDYFKRPLVKAISMYLQKMILQNNVMAMFSDCNIKEGYWIGLPHMLKTIYPDDIEKLPADRGTIMAYVHLCFSLRSVVYYNPDFVTDKLENKAYPTLCYFTKRTDYYGFAAKGGNNGESHNHNDVASFILTRNNKEIFCDLGYIGPCNTPGYHGSRRYEYFNPSSFSHSVPYFNGKGQDGTDMRDDVFTVYDEKSETLTMDFAQVYEVDVPQLKKATRVFTFSDDVITLKDKFEVTEKTEIVERFVTTIKPVITGDTVTVDDVRVSACGIKPRIIEVPFVNQLMQENGTYDDIAYCVEFVLPENETEITVTFDMSNQ